LSILVTLRQGSVESSDRRIFCFLGLTLALFQKSPPGPSVRTGLRIIPSQLPDAPIKVSAAERFCCQPPRSAHSARCSGPYLSRRVQPLSCGARGTCKDMSIRSLLVGYVRGACGFRRSDFARILRERRDRHEKPTLTAHRGCDEQHVHLLRSYGFPVRQSSLRRNRRRSILSGSCDSFHVPPFCTT